MTAVILAPRSPLCVTGIGQQTAALLAGFMPELGALTRRKAASLAGCAPHPRDSGALRGYRATTGGRAVIKRALFMAAITAVMRKLIVMLNAMLRDAQPQKTW